LLGKFEVEKRRSASSCSMQMTIKVYAKKKREEVPIAKVANPRPISRSLLYTKI
jgi:hypothetical protein